MAKFKLSISKIGFILICLCLSISFVSGHWTYGSQADSEGWIGQCLTGQQQSPIEIQTNETELVETNPFIFEFYSTLPQAESLTNNGHSITFTLKPVREITFPKVVGGGLPDVFQFEQFHFHWGLEDKRGSEHNIDGAVHPMELHLVHFNSLYGSSMGDAVNNSKGAWDTLAVVAVLFEIQGEDNPALDPITDHLQSIKFQGQVYSNISLFPLGNLLPKDLDKFYRYNGSLTTPPCSEIVVWTLFKDPIYISENQMKKFRAVGDLPKGSGKFETESDNFRDHQPLNHRKVLLMDAVTVEKYENSTRSNESNKRKESTTEKVVGQKAEDQNASEENVKIEDQKAEDQKALEEKVNVEGQKAEDQKATEEKTKVGEEKADVKKAEGEKPAAPVAVAKSEHQEEDGPAKGSAPRTASILYSSLIVILFGLSLN